MERSGKGQRNLTLNAAPINVADYLRRRLFGADTSVIMTSATLATVEAKSNAAGPRERHPPLPLSAIAFLSTVPATIRALAYFASQASARKRPPSCKPARPLITSGR